MQSPIGVGVNLPHRISPRSRQNFGVKVSYAGCKQGAGTCLIGKYEPGNPKNEGQAPPGDCQSTGRMRSRATGFTSFSRMKR